ncbi:hypothetical protein AAMO2058_000868600 [Amorphochlora amoebiformis]
MPVGACAAHSVILASSSPTILRRRSAYLLELRPLNLSELRIGAKVRLLSAYLANLPFKRLQSIILEHLDDVHLAASEPPFGLFTSSIGSPCFSNIPFSSPIPNSNPNLPIRFPRIAGDIK